MLGLTIAAKYYRLVPSFFLSCSDGVVGVDNANQAPIKEKWRAGNSVGDLACRTYFLGGTPPPDGRSHYRQLASLLAFASV